MTTITKTVSLDAVIALNYPSDSLVRTIYSQPGFVSTDLVAALKAGRQEPIAKVRILNSSTRLLIAEVTDDVDDGSVTVDVSRGTRRTVQLRLVNKNGQYTPTTSSDYFSFNSLIQVYRGLRYTSSDGYETEEYVLLGTFMVDRSEVFVERNMAVLTVDGSDLWKKIATGGFPAGFSYAAGTDINTVIAKVANDSGIDSKYLSLWAGGYTLGKDIAWEPGASRSDFLSNLAKQYGLQMYFDVNGYLVTKPIPDPVTTAPVWSFTKGEDAVMLGVTLVQSDLKLVNHIIVTGENSDGSQSGARAEIRDNDPTSPTYWETIGDRTLLYSAPLVATNAQALLVAQKLYAENALIEEQIKLPSICLPHLEGNDVIEVVEPDLAKVNDKFLCQRFDVPLRETRMVIETKRGRPLA